MMTQPYSPPPWPFPAAAPERPPKRLSESHTQSDFAIFMRRFAPISLAQMDDVALLNRTDTKFVLSAGQLHGALAGLTTDYRVLDIAGIRLNQYQTLYFDTVNFAMYLRHHAGGRERYKIRSRQYVDSNLAFLEIKHKTNKNRTVKSRLQTIELVTRFNPESRIFLQAHQPFTAQALEPKLWNNFVRITLVSQLHQERLTLDLNLQFSYDQVAVTLPGLAIAEVKQAGYNPDSPFIRQMRALSVHPTGFSKYCLGVSMLYPEIKHNNFKPKLRLIQQLLRGNPYVH